MKKVLQWLAGSFEAGLHGASARKLTAFSCVAFAAYVHRYCTPDSAVQFLIVDLCCALIALGIVTFEQIIKLKNGITTEKNTPDREGNNRGAVN